jgi:hypothetical protein
VQYFNGKKPVDEIKKDFMKIFITCMDYPELLKDDESREHYFHVMEKLRVESQGKLRIWNAVQKIWDKVM